MSDPEVFLEFGDEFDGDDEFREVIVCERDSCETRRVVAGLDADWFAENPDEVFRIRRYVPGEFDSDSGGFVGDPTDFVVLVIRNVGPRLFPLGTFEVGAGWRAGGLSS